MNGFSMIIQYQYIYCRVHERVFYACIQYGSQTPNDQSVEQACCCLHVSALLSAFSLPHCTNPLPYSDVLCCYSTTVLTVLCRSWDRVYSCTVGHGVCCTVCTIILYTAEVCTSHSLTPTVYCNCGCCVYIFI